jgi:hypothetical protein
VFPTHQKLVQAFVTSNQWKDEKEAGIERTSCVVNWVPRDIASDIALMITIGRNAGIDLITALELEDQTTRV